MKLGRLLRKVSLKVKMDQMVVGNTEIEELNKKGTELLNEKGYSEAQNCFVKALDLAKQKMNQRLIAESSFNIGKVKIREGNLEEGLEYYKKALSLVEPLGDKKLIFSMTTSIGNVYIIQKKLDEALSMLERCLKGLKSESDDNNKLNIYYKIGTIQLEQKKLQEALDSFETALTIATQLNNMDFIKRTEVKIATIRDKLEGNRKSKQKLVLQTNKTMAKISQNENSVELSQPSVNINVLRNEAEVKDYVLQIYFLSSLFSFLFSILLLMMFFINSEFLVYLVFNLFVSFGIIGPLFALIQSTSFREQRFYYNSLTQQDIIQQIKTDNYNLVQQNENHYIFEKNANTLTNVTIVLVFEKNFFLIYGPQKVRDRQRKTFQWHIMFSQANSTYPS